MKKEIKFLFLLLFCCWFFICLFWSIVTTIASFHKNHPPSIKSNFGYYGGQVLPSAQSDKNRTFFSQDGKIIMSGRKEGNSTIYRNTSGKIVLIEK